MSGRIKVLDEKTINKIAAGEVIERPSSVIKELVENSIDAKSTSIILEIKNGGKDYIRITDNGIGIEKDDIKLSILRHSTSKITHSDDLNTILSLGFRGEALASIAAVSQLTLLSKVANDLSGRQIEINGGNIIKETDIGCPKGTTIIVKNLFYNTPVRKDFLKNESVESSYISDVIQKLSLSYPNISFKYIRDNKVILLTPGKGDLSSTIYSVFGKDFMNSLYEIHSSQDELNIKGYICKPSFTRGNRGHQYIFLNGRIINSKLISKAVEDIYKSLIPINRYPIFLLYININPKIVDVNVHPTKLEVRFQNESFITNVIKTKVKDVLKNNNLIPEVKFNLNKKSDDMKQENFIDYIKDDKKQSTSNISNNDFNDNTLDNTLDITKSENTIKPTDLILIKEEGINYNLNENINVESNLNFNVSNQTVVENKKSIIEPKERIPLIRVIGRLFSTYILGEGIDAEAFYFIDQHAAHERVTYEKYRKEFESEKVISQKLLVPEVINLLNTELELLKSNIETFKKLGFEIEEFGFNSIILRSVPVIFGNPNSKDLFLTILDKLDDNVKSSYELNLEKIIKLACTNSIKGGDKISDIEIESLVNELNNCDNPYTCPHGRPIIIKMSKYEVEKKFKRIQ